MRHLVLALVLIFVACDAEEVRIVEPEGPEDAARGVDYLSIFRTLQDSTRTDGTVIITLRRPGTTTLASSRAGLNPAEIRGLEHEFSQAFPDLKLTRGVDRTRVRIMIEDGVPRLATDTVTWPLIKVRAPANPQVLEALSQHPLVAAVSPNYYATIHPTTLPPGGASSLLANVPKRLLRTAPVALRDMATDSMAWGLNAVDAPDVWNELGTRDVQVGFIDTGWNLGTIEHTDNNPDLEALGSATLDLPMWDCFSGTCQPIHADHACSSYSSLFSAPRCVFEEDGPIRHGTLTGILAIGAENGQIAVGAAPVNWFDPYSLSYYHCRPIYATYGGTWRTTQEAWTDCFMGLNVNSGDGFGYDYLPYLRVIINTLAVTDENGTWYNARAELDLLEHYGKHLIISSAGNDPNTVPFPTSHSATLGVGAVNGNGEIYNSPESSYPYTFLYAPGTSQLTGCSLWDQYACTWPHTVRAEGASMATAIAGGVGLIVQSAQFNPDAASIRDVLTSYTRDLHDGSYPDGTDQKYGYGLLNAYCAVNRVICDPVQVGGDQYMTLGLWPKETDSDPPPEDDGECKECF